jgi:hypothetical protein
MIRADAAFYVFSFTGDLQRTVMIPIQTVLAFVAGNIQTGHTSMCQLRSVTESRAAGPSDFG